MKKPERGLEFDLAAIEDLAWWVEKDRKKALRSCERSKKRIATAFGGIGKPEPLKHELAG